MTRNTQELRLTAYYFPHLEDLIKNYKKYGWELDYVGKPIWLKDYIFLAPKFLSVMRKKR